MEEVTVHRSTRLTAAKCLRAGFLSSASEGIVSYGAGVLIFVVIMLTFWLRNTAKPSAEEKNAPEAAATTNTSPENDESENAPPPYAPPTSSPPVIEPIPDEPTPVKPVVDFPNPKDTAPAFVLGTFLFAVLTFLLITLGFCIQYLSYCPEVDPDAPLSTGGIVAWCFYGVLVLGASSGFVSWVLLCWYVAGGVKQDWILDIIPLSLVVIALLPFMFLYQGAVGLVQGCQKWFCGVTFEDEQDTVVKEVEVDVEMQRLMKGDGNDGDDDDDDDDEVGGHS